MSSIPESTHRPDPTTLAVILLDYGGTLDGDAQHWFDHFLRLYADAGIALPTATIKHAFYTADAALEGDPAIREAGLDAMVRTHVRRQLAVLGRDREPALEDRLVTSFVDDTRRAWDRNRPLVTRLARRFRLGVVSNSYGNMPALLADAGLGPFELVLDSARVGLRKPDPALYARALADLDVPATTVLHVGDSWERDVEPAHAVGMRVAWLAAPTTPLPAATPPAWRLASLLDLEALLA